jgi:hypothetical protein
MAQETATHFFLALSLPLGIRFPFLRRTCLEQKEKHPPADNMKGNLCDKEQRSSEVLFWE